MSFFGYGILIVSLYAWYSWLRRRYLPPHLPLLPKIANDETSRLPWQKHYAFEHFVVRKFDRLYFELVEWRIEKDTHTTQQNDSAAPGLEYDYVDHQGRIHFALDCKWRDRLDADELPLFNYLRKETYKRLADKIKKPLYVVIGIGGTPSSPQELFVIPSAELPEGTSRFSKDSLVPYRKNNIHQDFLFQKESMRLL